MESREERPEADPLLDPRRFRHVVELRENRSEGNLVGDRMNFEVVDDQTMLLLQNTMIEKHPLCQNAFNFHHQLGI